MSLVDQRSWNLLWVPGLHKGAKATLGIMGYPPPFTCVKEDYEPPCPQGRVSQDQLSAHDPLTLMISFCLEASLRASKVFRVNNDLVNSPGHM